MNNMYVGPDKSTIYYFGGKRGLPCQKFVIPTNSNSNQDKM